MWFGCSGYHLILIQLWYLFTQILQLNIKNWEEKSLWYLINKFCSCFCIIRYIHNMEYYYTNRISVYSNTVHASVICQHFCRYSGKFALPILTILLVILVLGHVLQWTLHIIWQFMHEDGENSLFASVSCALMNHFQCFLLILHIVCFSCYFSFMYR